MDSRFEALYEILEELEKDSSNSEAKDRKIAAMRWAIFELERKFNATI